LNRLMNQKPCSLSMPKILGIVSRRILVNYSLDAETAQKLIPAIFRPKLVKGRAVIGICLIRLTHIRPFFVPKGLGVTSENVAHRIAVEWDVNGSIHEGVYIFRRDSNSLLKVMMGGRFFPGIHQSARFSVDENEDHFHISILSDDKKVEIEVDGTACHALPKGSVFESLEEASSFFENGSLGYSPTGTPGEYQGMELQTREWNLEPMKISKVYSSFFSDEERFPKGSIRFDSALLMRNVEHEWHNRGALCINDCGV
jgi:hypothetical protein